MNAMTDVTLYDRVEFTREAMRTAGPTIHNMFWGYYVPAQVHNRNPVVQSLFAVVALAFMTCGFLIWTGAYGAFATDLIVMKAIVSGFFLIFGFIIGSYAADASSPEIHIDTARGELRYAVRDSRDRVKLWARSSFLNVCDVVIIDEGGQHSLQIEFVDGREVWEIARGTKDALRPLMYRLNRDFSRGGLDSLVSRPDPKALR